MPRRLSGSTSRTCASASLAPESGADPRSHPGVLSRLLPRKLLEGWQKQAGLGSGPRTVIEEMARIQSVDVVLPLEDGPELRLRCVVRPDGAQGALLDRLGLALPQRLRPPPMAGKM